MSSNYHFVLGAKDEEMDVIEKALRLLELPFMYAGVEGKRVTQDTAYDADGLVTPDTLSTITLSGTIVTVECDVTGVTPDTFIGHHRAGDPGYSGLPADYFDSSSVGSVYNLVVDPGEGFTVPQVDAAFGGDRINVVAAADHCLQEAYQEECPDVTHLMVLNYRAELRARELKSTVEYVRGLFIKATRTVQGCPTVTLGAFTYKDATGLITVGEIEEGAVLAQTAVQYHMVDSKGKTQVILANVKDTDFVNVWVSENIHRITGIVHKPLEFKVYGYLMY